VLLWRSGQLPDFVYAKRRKTIHAEPQIVKFPRKSGRKRPEIVQPVPPAPLQPWPNSHDQRPRVELAFLYFIVVPCELNATPCRIGGH
jgi:hypothetical protein